MNIHSVVLIDTAAKREAVNAAADSLGYGPNNLCVALTTDGETITHYGCQAWATDAFLAVLEANRETLLADAIISVRTHDQRKGHFNAVLEANGLQRFVVPEEQI